LASVVEREEIFEAVRKLQFIDRQNIFEHLFNSGLDADFSKPASRIHCPLLSEF